jgi:lipid-A-disaccharide synthase
MSRPLRIMITAGEASGDRLGAGLAQALRARRPDVELSGMGGQAMAEAGVRLLEDAAQVAVMGLFEVLTHLAPIRRVLSRLETRLSDWQPDLLVPIDFPDFNLRLAAAARRAGVPVVYFVSPQVWAWRKGRLRALRGLVRRMLLLYPFESEIYRAAGIPHTFVGHPAIDQVPSGPPPPGLWRTLRLQPERPVVGLLPGSRRGEVERMAPVMLGAAQALSEHRHDLQFLVPKASTLPPGFLEAEFLADANLDVRIHDGDYPALLPVCTAAITTSGTASLEVALAGVPQVVVYRMNPLSYLLARLLVRVEHMALPNLEAGRRIVPELLQGDCTVENVAASVRPYLDSRAAANESRQALAEVRRHLGEPGVFDRAATAVLAEAGRAGL